MKFPTLKIMKTSLLSKSLLLLCSIFTLGAYAQGPTCATADPFCTGTPITFPAGTNSGTGEAGPDYGCLLTQPNPAWYYMEIATGGALEITISNSNNEDIDFIVWGPFVDATSPCTALLTAGNTVDCSYSTTATEVAFINPTNAGEFYLMMVTNFSNNATDISFQETGPTTATTNCAIVCPPVEYGVFNSGTGQIDQPPATMACNDPAVAFYADQDGFNASEAITPCYVVQVFPTNGIGTNSMEFFEDGASLGGFGTVGTDSNGNPWVTSIGANTNFSGYVSYVSPSSNTPGHQVVLCNNTAGANMTYEVYDCHSGTLLASGTWNGAVGCQTILVSPPPTLSGLATWSSTCAGSLPVITDWGAAVFDPSAVAPGTTCDVTYDWDAQNGDCAGSATHSITITNPYSFTSLSYSSPVCQAAGGTLNPTLTGTAGGTYTSSPAGLSLNGTTGAINVAASTPGTYTVSYFVGTALPSACNASGTASITILPDVDPAWSNPSPICETGGSINLNTLITGTAGGTWSGTGVSGNTFNPSGLSGSIAVTYTVGTAPCAENSTLNITVEPDVDPSWTSPGTICANAGSINLNTTITGTTGGTWSGTGVTGNTFNPSGLSGNISVTYTVGNAPCAENSTQNITVEPDVDPAWTDPSPVCETGGSINLNTLITGTTGGTWSGTGVSGNTFDPTGLSGSIAVTYTVGNAPCAENSTINITVEPDVDPSWTTPGTICANAGSINLNTTITGTTGGTWSGTGVSGNTFDPSGLSGNISVTYTVGNAPCSEASTQTITVEPDVDPAWTDPSPVCETGGSINLNTLITGTTGGTWSGTGVSGNTFDPTGLSGSIAVTYTVGNAPCAENSTINITVEPDVDPTWTDPSPVCANGGTINLNTLITGTTGGTWSGTGVSGNTFDPSGLSGSIAVTYTVGNAPCAENSTININVEPDVDPAWTDPSPVCATGGTIDLNTLITGTTGGSWSGTGVSGNTFDPSGLSGSIAVTYTVGNAPCAENSTININVEPDVDPTWIDPSPVCATGGTIDLSTLITGTTGGSWSGTGVSGTTFDPSGLSGSIAITYTVGNAPCAENSTINVNVEPDVDPTWSQPAALCESDAAIDLNTFITGTGGGTWSGPGVTGNMFDPAGQAPSAMVTYTVGNNPCDEASTLTITVNPDDDPSFSYPQGTYCLTGTDPVATITGLGGGTFTGSGALVINGGDGTIDLDASGVGTYTVTYTTNGPCPQTSQVTIDITTAPDATFNYPGSPYCQSDANPFPTFPPGSSAGTFSATPAGLVFVNNGTGEVDLAGSTPGIYTVTNNIPAGGGCAEANATATIEIIADDVATFDYAQLVYCQGDTDPLANITGTTGGTFSEGTGDVVFLDNSTGEIDLSASVPGATYTITYTTTGQCPASGTFDITIEAEDDPTFTYPQASYCESEPNPTPTVTGTAGGTFSEGTGNVVFVDQNTGEIDLLGSTPGSYYILYTTGGVCANVDSVALDILPDDDPSFSYSNSTYCQTGTDPTPTITGLAGGTFSEGTGNLVIDTNSGLVDLDASPLGTYTVEYATNGPCPQTGTFVITITDAPDATFDYPGTPFCNNDVNQLPTFPPGSSAGVFSATPAGLTFVDVNTGEIDIAGSTPGIYVITNDIAAGGGCAAASATDTIEILPMDDPTFDYASNTYCSTDANPFPNITGLTGGTFSEGTGDLVVDPVTGEIDLAGSLIGGPYTITYVTNGPCPDSTTFDITITNQLSAVIDAAGPFCESDAAVNLTAADAGGTWSGNGITDANAGTFDPATAGPGTHTITYSIPGGCGDTQTEDITVNPDDNAGFTYASANYCNTDANPTPTITGTAGGTFSEGSGNVVFVDANTGEVDLTNSTPGGPYTITYTTNGSCPASSTFDITIGVTQDATITQVGPFCDTDPAVFLTAVDGGGTWSGNGVDPNTGEFDPAAAGPGSHVITYTIGGLCGDVQSITIDVGGPVASFTANPTTGFIPLDVDFTNTSTGATAYAWDFGDGNNSTATDPTNTYTDFGNFTVTLVATDAFGCVSTATAVIDVDAESTILIPNVFSPNGDQTNDIFAVFGTNLKEVTGTIMNRWGEVLYEWDSTKGGWDGRTTAGVIVPDGTYYYIIKVIGADDKLIEQQGSVTLIR